MEPARSLTLFAFCAGCAFAAWCHDTRQQLLNAKPYRDRSILEQTVLGLYLRLSVLCLVLAVIALLHLLSHCRDLPLERGLLLVGALVTGTLATAATGAAVRALVTLSGCPRYSPDPAEQQRLETAVRRTRRQCALWSTAASLCIVATVFLYQSAF